MSEYVAFKCSLCSTEAASLENLEGHIWNRHLGTFQYCCAECSYPALNYQALSSHFLAHHQDCQDIQFKRKITDEIKLRDIIAASLVVPLYEEDEQMYDVASQVPVAGEMEPVGAEEAEPELGRAEEGEIIEHVDRNGQPIIYMKQEYRREEYLDEPGPSMLGEQEEVVISTDAADDSNYPIFSGHELLEDEYQYVDEELNTVYVTDPYPFSNEKPRNSIAMQVAKQRRIGMTVDHVAHKKQRSTTIWPCPDCRKIIRHPSRIEAHRRMHAGEKPFTCTVCDQKFSRKGALKCHLRAHSGEKPYVCTWDCGKAFVSSSQQRAHERTHSGEKRYTCQICGQLYGKRSHLVRHEQTRHGADPEVELKGLDIAGSSMDLLRNIVEGIVEEVQNERVKALPIDDGPT